MNWVESGNRRMKRKIYSITSFSVQGIMFLISLQSLDNVGTEVSITMSTFASSYL